MSDLPPHVTADALRDIKRRNAYLRESIRSRGLERSAKLHEAYANAEWMNVYSDMLDRFRNQDLSNFSISNVADRRFGMNYPVFRNETDLALMRMPSRILCATNNYAIGLLSGLTSYVIGAGYDYRAAAMKGMEDHCPKELLAACQQIIDDFQRINQWKGGEQPGIEEELFWRSCEDGEFFLRLFPQDDGRTFVRTVEPEQVTCPPGWSQEEGMFGVMTDPNDAQGVQGYYVFYGTDIANGDIILPAEMIHLRRNVKRSIKRGMPDFSFATYDTLMLADKLRRAIGLGASIQASIAWVKQHEVASKEEVQSYLDTLDNALPQTTNLQTGNTQRNQRIEPGTIIEVDKGTSYVAPPSAGANGTAHLAMLQMLAQAGGNRWNAPAWLATADNTSANYATALTEESPFVRTVVRAQGGYKAAFVRPHWYALEHFIKSRGTIVVNVKKGEQIEQRRYSWDDVRKLVDIQVEAHSPEVRNKTEEAQANAIRLQGGWKSPQTIQAEEGLDSDRERTNLLEWRDQMGQSGGGMQLPSGDNGMPPNPFASGSGLEARPTPESFVVHGHDGQTWLSDGVRLIESAEIGVPPQLDAHLRERGFSGTVTDKLGRKIHYSDGKRVKGQVPDATTKTGKPQDVPVANPQKAATPEPDKADTAHAEEITKPIPKGILGGLASIAKKTFGAVGHVEHLAKEWIGNRVNNLPEPLRVPVVAVYKASFVTFSTVQHVADKVAEARGCNEAQRATIANVCGTIDVIGMKAVPAALGAVGIGGAVAVGASFVPVGSCAYLGYSLARNPIKTLRAAKNSVGEAIKKLREEGVIKLTKAAVAKPEKKEGEHHG